MGWTVQSAKKDLLKNWTDPLSLVAFQGSAKLYKYYDGKLTHSQIQKILSSFESYSVMRHEHSSKNRTYQGYNFPISLWNVCEVDSFSIQELSAENHGIQHLMCVVNTFSRMAWVGAMKDRSSQSGLNVLMDIFSIAGKYPDALLSDKGGECSAAVIKEHLKKNGCKSVITQGLNKGRHQ